MDSKPSNQHEPDQMSALFFEDYQVTEEIVAYYQENPKELDLIIDKEHFDMKFLYYIFIVGMILTVGARVLTFFFSHRLGAFVNQVVLDVISEIGIAIFGGAVTAFLLNHLQKKQFKKNVAFRNEIKKRIAEAEQK